MNILIVKLSPIETITSSMFRTIAVARGLEETGNNVDMLVVPYNGMIAVDRKKDFIKKINIIRSGECKAYSRVANVEGRGIIKKKIITLLKKIWHMLSVYDYTYSVVKKLRIDILPRHQYDIVISSSDPKTSHIAVKKLMKQGLKCDRWIQYWGDPLTLDITKVNIWPDFILKRIESNLIKGADKVVYVSPFTLEEQKKLFPQKAGKMDFVPVAYMEEEIYPKPQSARFVIGYYGNYEIRVRNIIPLYNACINMGAKVDVSFYGDTDLSLTSSENVKIYPRGIVEEHKAKADLLICLLNSSGAQIPGKLYHLAGTNKKVLVIVDGERTVEMRRYLNGFKRFYICENNEKSIEQKIVEIMNDNSEFYPSKELRYDKIAAKIIE